MVGSGKFLFIFTLDKFKSLMTTFIGEYSCKVDAKGRIVLPSAFKKQMATEAQDKFVVKKDIFENCLVLFPMDEWQRQVELIRKKLNPYNREHNKFQRNFFLGMAELSLDNINRLLVPSRLIQLVDIKQDVILLGQDEKIEIWSSEVYGKIGMEQDDFASLAEKLMGGNLNVD